MCLSVCIYHIMCCIHHVNVNIMWTSYVALAQQPQTAQRIHKYRPRNKVRTDKSNSDSITRWIVDQQFRETQQQLGIPLGECILSYVYFREQLGISLGDWCSSYLYIFFYPLWKLYTTIASTFISSCSIYKIKLNELKQNNLCVISDICPIVLF